MLSQNAFSCTMYLEKKDFSSEPKINVVGIGIYTGHQNVTGREIGPSE